MTASSPMSANTNSTTTTTATSGAKPTTATTTPTNHSNNNQATTTNTSNQLLQASCPSFTGSSAAFQQVKQTQASLARLIRVQQQQQSQNGQTNLSSQQQSKSVDQTSSQQTKSTTFVDCLIRRFKDCFNEDCFTVPMFVVGNLSPGSDGTHLILPPCVSLGGQNISRFSSPKNLRLINSIRKSCHSIEELDLGCNKLTDLIEVYKILQCTPNLRFLNLSENDLSRTSPVAMATSSCTTNTPTSVASGSSVGLLSGASSTIAINSQLTTTIGSGSSTCIPNWGASSGPSNQRACLVPINQNQPQQTIGARRHSTLGHSSATNFGQLPTSSSSISTQIHNRARPVTSRATEVRRLAATNALAQSKKTSSSMASKIASSVAANRANAHPSSESLRMHRTSDSSSCSKKSDPRQIDSSRCQRSQKNATSTMHLARSLSSLSAKDLRAANSPIGRLGPQRSNVMKDTGSRDTIGAVDRNRRTSLSAINNLLTPNSRISESQHKLQNNLQQVGFKGSANKITTSTSHQKLFAEPIAESDDVEMCPDQPSPHQVTPSNSTTTTRHNSLNTTASSSTFNTRQASPASGRALASLPAGNGLLLNASAVGRLGGNFNHGSAASSMGYTNQMTSFRRVFQSIKALALNNTGCQWRVVCSILSRMPNLEELHLSLNNYERIDLDPNEFKHYNLKRLYLCNNPKLTNWQELNKLLIAFPSLQALSIANCNISQIPDNLDRASEWKKLCGLNINGWPIKEWPVVERLNQLPSLIDLKCRNLEVLNTIDEPRHHLIARLPKLQRLNGSEIEEREDAEKAFLRFFMANSHLERPSRFHELIQIHGEVVPVDVDVDLSPPSHAQVRVIYLNRNYYRKENEDDVIMSEDFLTRLMDNIDNTINLVQESTTSNQVGGTDALVSENMDVTSGSAATGHTNDAELDEPSCTPLKLFKDEGQEVVAIEVDLRQSVRKFKSTIADIFGLQGQNLLLYYIDHEMFGLMGPELIKHNQKKLWNYNVQDGDQFIVEER